MNIHAVLCARFLWIIKLFIIHVYMYKEVRKKLLFVTVRFFQYLCRSIYTMSKILVFRFRQCRKFINVDRIQNYSILTVSNPKLFHFDHFVFSQNYSILTVSKMIKFWSCPKLFNYTMTKFIQLCRVHNQPCASNLHSKLIS